MAKADKQGTITAINEFVRLDLTGDYDTGTLQVFGTYTGALTVQATLNGTTWVTLGGSTALTNLFMLSYLVLISIAINLDNLYEFSSDVFLN